MGGRGVCVAGFPSSPPWTSSVQIVLNNYPQRKKKSPVEQILHFCLLWGCSLWSLLIQPSLPPPVLCLGHSVVMSQ